jgi:multidrug efflux pump subunit AcrA (membrane-fusion protein)
MNIEVMGANAARHAIYDKLESEIKTAEAKLDTLKARAEVAKANAEIKAIAALAAHGLEIHHQLLELKRSSEDQCEQAKTDLEARIAAFEKAVNEVEAKAKGHWNKTVLVLLAVAGLAIGRLVARRVWERFVNQANRKRSSLPQQGGKQAARV